MEKVLNYLDIYHDSDFLIKGYLRYSWDSRNCSLNLKYENLARFYYHYLKRMQNFAKFIDI